MNNYKIIFLVLVAAAIAFFVWRQNEQIHSLEQKVAAYELTIQQQDNKLKEQLTQISILETDTKNKEIAIGSLQTKIDLSTKNCQDALQNLIDLSEISGGVANQIKLPPEVEVALEEFVEKKSSAAENTNQTQNLAAGLPTSSISITNQLTNDNKQKDPPTYVLNKKASKSYVDLRNRIYSKYR